MGFLSEAKGFNRQGDGDFMLLGLIWLFIWVLYLRLLILLNLFFKVRE